MTVDSVLIQYTRSLFPLMKNWTSSPSTV